MKYLRILCNQSFAYPYYTSTSMYMTTLTADMLYPPVPYYFGEYLIRNTNGSVLTYANGLSYIGIANYMPDDYTSRYVGVSSTGHNNSSGSESSYNSPVGMYKIDGDYTYSGSSSYHLTIKEVNATDVSNMSFTPIADRSIVSLISSDLSFFNYSINRYMYLAYYIDVSGVYGDFDFIGIIVCPYTNDLYFINKYPQMSEIANPNCGDLPAGLSHYGLTLDNILYGLNDNEYLKVDLDTDSLETITFNDTEIPENFYVWLNSNYDRVYTGQYKFTKSSGEVIADLTAKPAITHYEFITGDNNFELILTYETGLQDVITWHSTGEDSYVMSGLKDSAGNLVFVANTSTDCNIYGTYEFSEFWEKQILPSDTFVINLYWCRSDNNVINKNLVERFAIEGALKDSCSLTDPIVMITVTDDEVEKLLTESNYCYIEKFGRFYFINDIKIYRTGLYILYCHVDVLETFKNGFGNSACRVVRSSTHYDEDLVDDKAIQYGRDYIEVTPIDAISNALIDAGEVYASQYFNPCRTLAGLGDECYWLITVLGEN